MIMLGKKLKERREGALFQLLYFYRADCGSIPCISENEFLLKILDIPNFGIKI